VIARRVFLLDDMMNIYDSTGDDVFLNGRIFSCSLRFGGVGDCVDAELVEL